MTGFGFEIVLIVSQKTKIAVREQKEMEIEQKINTFVIAFTNNRWYNDKKISIA